MNPGQELSNGFCYDKCPTGFSPYGALCLQNCPVGFTDHGMGCEAPSQLRTSIKASIEPCSQGQIDKNGDCYEPQSFIQTSLGPKAIGCGCIRRQLKDRIQCPGGYQKYNNSCVSACSQGFKSIVNASGQISSLLCIAECPKNINSKTQWTSSASLCVKPARKRLPHSVTSTIVYPDYGIPNTMLSMLAKKPLGTSLNERVRTGQSVGASQAAKPGSNFFLESWSTLFNQPVLIVSIIGFLIFLFYAGPSIFRGLGKLIGSTASAAGSVATAAGSVAEGAGSLAKGTLDLASSTVEQVSDLQKKASAVLEKSTAAQNLSTASQNLQSAKIEQAAATIKGAMGEKIKSVFDQ